MSNRGAAIGVGRIEMVDDYVSRPGRVSEACRRRLALLAGTGTAPERRSPHGLAAGGESLAAFDERCIPKPPQCGCRVGGPGAGGVASPSNTPGILSRRALPAGRLARLGATPDFHHGLLGLKRTAPSAAVAVS